MKGIYYGRKKGALVFATLGSILLGFIAPLIVWLTNKDKFSPDAKEAARVMLNFELSLAIIGIITGVLTFAVPVLSLVSLLIGLINIIVPIIACINVLNCKVPQLAAFNLIK